MEFCVCERTTYGSYLAVDVTGIIIIGGMVYRSENVRSLKVEVMTASSEYVGCEKRIRGLILLWEKQCRVPADMFSLSFIFNFLQGT